MKPRKTYSAKCGICGKIVRILPAGGDWTNALYPIRHKDRSGNSCRGWTVEIPTRAMIEPTTAKGRDGV